LKLTFVNKKISIKSAALELGYAAANDEGDAANEKHIQSDSNARRER
jgi:hypothetical protein